MPDQIDQIMEQASEALATMDYSRCELACVQALTLARDGERWADYGRILLPLQESRRQRRMTAAEGAIRLGTAGLADDPQAWIDQHEAGCLLVGPIPDAQPVDQLREQAIHDGRPFEIFAWLEPDAAPTTQSPAWTVAAGSFTCTVPPPASQWQDQTLNATSSAHPDPRSAEGDGPVEWFLDVLEQLGDRVIRESGEIDDPIERLALLEEGLGAVPDHELLHQRLLETARDCARDDTT
ncbi:MAG: hypothetical protein R3336_01070 [Phycisphaeraceae bacterium]|nr:hypothetical protein [Phycisphaeraceae bacterium]